MQDAVKEALGLVGEEGNGIENDQGLFGLKSRRFGQGAAYLPDHGGWFSRLTGDHLGCDRRCPGA